MRLYLAGPMTGRADFNFSAFHEAAAKLRAEGHYVFNPAELGCEMEYRQAMAIDLAYLCSAAEGIVLLPGWRNSKGATAEHATAVALGLEVIEL